MNNNVFDKIKNLCEEHNITIAQLETTLKFGSSTISKWKSANPTIEKLSIVADYFNVSVDYLLGRKTLNETLTDKRIISFQRAMEKIPQEKQEQTMKILAAFDDAFSEDE